jgi:hypothetical protein
VARAIGCANNYAGTNLSNLDVTLATMQSVAPETKVIVFVQPAAYFGRW